MLTFILLGEKDVGKNLENFGSAADFGEADTEDVEEPNESSPADGVKMKDKLIQIEKSQQGSVSLINEI